MAKGFRPLSGLSPSEAASFSKARGARRGHTKADVGSADREIPLGPLCCRPAAGCDIDE